MSDDLLRRAVAVLRDLAGKAQHERPWCPEHTYAAVRHVERNVDLDLDCPDHAGEGCPRFDMYDGRYVALMHPPVALALAELIDEFIEGDAETHAEEDWAIVILARAILREEP
jgi:hypothetical protein